MKTIGLRQDFSADIKREMLKRYWRDQEKLKKKLLANGVPLSELGKHLAPFPRELMDMTCGAKSKRTGEPCRLKAIYSNGRCKFHGGLSTGPRSIEGKAMSAMNGNCKKRTP